MAKTSSDLKAAIRGLNIQKPYSLRELGQVRLKPPQVEETQNEAPQFERPDLDASQEVARRSVDPRAEIPNTEVPQSEAARNESPRIEPPQDRDRSASQGFFMLAHSFFLEPRVRKLTGDAFRTFLWMSSQAWRFEESQGVLRASVTFIQEAIGVSSASVSRSLAVLKDEQLIDLIEVNYRRGNLWKVSPIASGRAPRTKQSEVPRSEQPATSIRGGTDINPMEQPPQIDAEIRISNNPKKPQEPSLPEGTFRGQIATYLEGIKAPRKRESESRALSELRRSFSETEVEAGLNWVLAYGLPDSGGTCHSPLAFLAKALPDVLKRVQAHQNRAALDQAAKASLISRREAEAAASAKEEEDFQEKLLAFHVAFPSNEAQAAYVRRFHSRYPVLSPDGPALRNLAISAWRVEEGPGGSS